MNKLTSNTGDCCGVGEKGVWADGVDSGYEYCELVLPAYRERVKSFVGKYPSIDLLLRVASGVFDEEVFESVRLCKSGARWNFSKKGGYSAGVVLSAGISASTKLYPVESIGRDMVLSGAVSRFLRRIEDYPNVDLIDVVGGSISQFILPVGAPGIAVSESFDSAFIDGDFPEIRDVVMQFFQASLEEDGRAFEYDEEKMAHVFVDDGPSIEPLPFPCGERKDGVSVCLTSTSQTTEVQVKLSGTGDDRYSCWYLGTGYEKHVRAITLQDGRVYEIPRGKGLCFWFKTSFFADVTLAGLIGLGCRVRRTNLAEIRRVVQFGSMCYPSRLSHVGGDSWSASMANLPLLEGLCYLTVIAPRRREAYHAMLGKAPRWIELLGALAPGDLWWDHLESVKVWQYKQARGSLAYHVGFGDGAGDFVGMFSDCMAALMRANSDVNMKGLKFSGGQGIHLIAMGVVGLEEPPDVRRGQHEDLGAWVDDLLRRVGVQGDGTAVLASSSAIQRREGDVVEAFLLPVGSAVEIDGVAVSVLVDRMLVLAVAPSSGLVDSADFRYVLPGEFMACLSSRLKVCSSNAVVLAYPVPPSRDGFHLVETGRLDRIVKKGSFEAFDFATSGIYRVSCLTGRVYVGVADLCEGNSVCVAVSSHVDAFMAISVLQMDAELRIECV